MNEIDSSNQESVMKGKPKRPKGKQVAGARYKSSLIPMAVSVKHKRQKTSKFKRTARRK